MIYSTELHLHQHQQTFPCCWEGSPSPAALPERIPLFSLPTKAPFTLRAPSTHQLPQSSSSTSSPSVSLRKQRGWASDLTCSPGAILVELGAPLKDEPCSRKEPAHPREQQDAVLQEERDMRSLSCLLWGLLLILSTASTEGFAPAGTIYRVAYRQRFRQLPQPMASCCPGWSRANGHTLGCNRAVCWEPCQNGGSCAFPGRCSCPPGWTGRACQTDVDECASQSHGCSQLCINTAGSFQCACQDGFSLAADAKGCQPLVPAPGTDTSSQAGASSEMKEEMKDLRSRVEALEQKLQLVLAPFHNLMPPEDVGADPISRLSHSLQQLDRIDSLSEQISFLEERLETCSCKNEL
ncbi:epidermal growth factor-like protein 7 isoform X3 [Ammospiza nelsoni]|uniref:epidermal growth factor-like protein 7 isoform X3 n=2 Tax=Ammospiza TaxID=2517974 RepID=UPI00286D107A|nr:epidermal growth factor-like protein 7 isoform X3 [Ammospiza nelsoni]